VKAPTDNTLPHMKRRETEFAAQRGAATRNRDEIEIADQFECQPPARHTVRWAAGFTKLTNAVE